MDGTDMQTPGDAAARYSFLFPIGESRRFKPSHPTIRAMCVNGTLSLANPPRRPRDLLPHSAPSGRCCSRSAVPCFWVSILLRREPAPTHQASAVFVFHLSRLQPLPRGRPSLTPFSTWRLRFPRRRLVPFLFHHTCVSLCVHNRTGSWRGCEVLCSTRLVLHVAAHPHTATVDHCLVFSRWCLTHTDSNDQTLGYSNSSECGYCRGTRSGQSTKRESSSP